jgi:hypothetical protein
MKHRHSAALLITTGLFAAGVVAPADAIPGGSATERCTGFHARGVGVDLGLGNTTATLYRGNREVATSVGTLVLGPVDPETLVATFTGNIVLTNANGTLTAQVDGTFDTVSGSFAAVSTDLSGTDGYADTTGRLRFRGTEGSDLTFTEHVYGKLCVPKVKKDKKVH